VSSASTKARVVSMMRRCSGVREKFMSIPAARISGTVYLILLTIGGGYRHPCKN
jgi:hypothetical protein